MKPSVSCEDVNRQGRIWHPIRHCEASPRALASKKNGPKSHAGKLSRPRRNNPPSDQQLLDHSPWQIFVRKRLTQNARHVQQPTSRCRKTWQRGHNLGHSVSRPAQLNEPRPVHETIVHTSAGSWFVNIFRNESAHSFETAEADQDCSATDRDSSSDQPHHQEQ